MPKCKQPQLSNEAFELIARRFSALSEPIRLKLIHALFDGEKCVGELVTLTGATQANVSRHLQTLTVTHVLARRREGLRVFYHIADPSINALCEMVCGSLGEQLSDQAGSLRRK